MEIIEKRREACRRWHRNHKEERKKYKQEYLHTPNGRASNLLSQYNNNDKKYNRGKGDLTAQWIVDNIFSKPCAHCRKEGWDIIGCNRLDDTKPHTMDNVEPCCEECNKKIQTDKVSKPINQIDIKTGEVVKTWNSVSECVKNGYNAACISGCCNGKYGRKTYKGYKWQFKPL